MEDFALIKSRVNLNRVNLGIALISDLKVDLNRLEKNFGSVFFAFHAVFLSAGFGIAYKILRDGTKKQLRDKGNEVIFSWDTGSIHPH